MSSFFSVPLGEPGFLEDDLCFPLQIPVVDQPGFGFLKSHPLSNADPASWSTDGNPNRPKEAVDSS